MDNWPRHNLVGLFLLGAIVALGVLVGSGGIVRWAAGQSGTGRVQVGNATPVISGFAVNNGTSVTPITNGTTTVTINFTVTDDNGCGSVFYSGNVTTTFFRSSTVATCATATPTQSLLSCYVVSTTTHNCPGANSTTTSANVTTTFQVWYFAEATDASSSYASDTWKAYAIAQDASSTQGASTSATGIEVNTLLAISLASGTLSYGQILPNTNTSGTNQVSNIKNAGNASTTLQLSGSALCAGSNCMPTSSQHYATNTFTYGGGEQQLQSAATAVSGWLVGSGVMGPWQTSTLIENFQDQVTITANSRIYMLGGWNGEGMTAVFYAPINPDGSLGSLATSTPTPTKKANACGFLYADRIYSLGGAGGDTDPFDTTSTNYSAPLASTGSVGTWRIETPLPTDRSQFICGTYNNYVYVVSGGPRAAATSSVLFAPISSTGTIGQWSSTTPLPSSVYALGGSVANGYIYAIGGADDGSVYRTSTYSAPIHATGSVGAWTTMAPLPYGLAYVTTAVEGNIIYMVSGYASGTVTSTVLFAPLYGSGTIGQWSRTTPIPVGQTYSPGAVWNGRAYQIGGEQNVNLAQWVALPSRNTYWGLGVPGGTPVGNYSSTITYTAVYSP